MTLPEDEQELNPRNVEDFLATARKRFAAASEDEKPLREKFLDDLRFASPDGDDQWDANVKAERLAARRPAMSFPRCHTFVQQVANDARQQKPQVKFAQSDSGDKESAEIMEGLARHIQYASDAQVAYDTAIEFSAAGSFGYYRVLTEYADDDTDDQEIVVKPILDPLTVYGILVPAVFGRKSKWWFVIEDMPKDEYKEKYGDKFLESSLDWAGAEKASDGWISENTVRIAEYWYVEEKRVKGKRRPQVKICFVKTNGLEILPGDDGESSETEWPGTRCNIIPVLGSQRIIAGKPHLYSVVRPQKAAQQMINYSKTRIAETLAQSPVSPYMAPEGSTEGFEQQWESLNKVPRPYITYKQYAADGRPLERPQRDVAEAPIAALSAFVAQEVDDMKATTGIFDASLGAQSNEQSGQAILRRQQQSNLNTMHFLDNLERSFKQAGECIGELIPIIYDVARLVKILGADESQKIVQINQQHTDASGKPKHFDLKAMKGTWVITMGKSYGSKRAESFDTIGQILQTAPNMFPILGDIMLRNSDMAGADEAADRIHAMLPPALQKNDNPIPPEAQAAIAQAQQQSQMMQGEMQKLQFERQAKVVEHQGKMQQIQVQGQTDMALEKMKLENAITVAEIQTKAQNTQERIAALEDMMSQFHAQAHEVAMAAQQHAQAQQMAAQQAQHQAALADQGVQNQSAQSAQDAAQSQAQQEAATQQE